MNNLKHESSPMPVTLVRPTGIFPEKAPKERWSGGISLGVFKKVTHLLHGKCAQV